MKLIILIKDNVMREMETLSPKSKYKIAMFAQLCKATSFLPCFALLVFLSMLKVMMVASRAQELLKHVIHS